MENATINRWAVLAGDIKVSHSVFALPFALLAMVLAAGGLPGGAQIALIVVCMVFARTYAMLTNRYFDREIDSNNPRTSGRALPSGQLSSRFVLMTIAATAGGLVLGAVGFGLLDQNWWPTVFSLPVLAWLGAYGLIKRFSLLCHFFLGAALAISPLAAALAIQPDYLAQPTLWWLAGFVLLWVGGFDVIYAIQDIDHDQRDGLHSVPAKLGANGALIVAKLAHLTAFAMLIMVMRTEPTLNRLFYAGIAAVGLLLIIEHLAASRGKFSMAFFTVNGVISLVLGGLGIADVLV
ncbi:MAG: UbiA-like polyprenyltransferase [Planctomycetota bacterium]|jgi:4-hydroxybenzoate polyprenyltransferase